AACACGCGDRAARDRAARAGGGGGAVTEALLVSNALLWIALLALAAVVLALVRQIGGLHERVAPAGAPVMGDGPKVGELAPRFAGDDLFGGAGEIGGAGGPGADTPPPFGSPRRPAGPPPLPAPAAA